ncbi:DUF1543 domain-containing protein [Neisseria leonii]|uniref:DUF1543 domain-containing protein n=1 Tax=Neisseria leonii TaxID=2995413 RepID=A0A9X4E7N3_9NEIS|nr:DUF1543 domain-containing protein [Neisseria sp. 51.81]MDD9327068.1 DUF1543 domain-containing protein [Neisseria sp. 51.81]
MKQLYLFYLGGHAGRANIEVHDVQFAACRDWREALPALKAAWFGDAGKIHIDGWQVVNWADGHDVRLDRTAPEHNGQKLYFVNVGGYRKDCLAEQHAFGLFVAPSPETAKQKALAVLLPDHKSAHKDNLKDIDNVLLLDNIGGAFVHLTPNPDGSPAPIGFQGYLPI